MLIFSPLFQAKSVDDRINRGPQLPVAHLPCGRLDAAEGDLVLGPEMPSYFRGREDVESPTLDVQRAVSRRVPFGVIGEDVDVCPTPYLPVVVVIGLWTEEDGRVGREVGGRRLDVCASEGCG